MTTREIYPNAPVVLVAVQARHPDAPPLTDGEQSELKRLVASRFPLPQPVQSQTITANLGAAPTITNQALPRFAARDQTTAVTFGPQAVTVETTSHKTFEELSKLVELAIDARQQVAEVPGLLRLGLRYVDEIRVPDLVEGVKGWREWVNPSLLALSRAGDDLGLETRGWEGATVFDRGEGRQVIVRYGPREGFAVAPGGPLQRSTPAPGPFFLLDIDSFWVPTKEVPEFTAAAVTERCADLHDPVSSLFEHLITDRLKSEVLRHA